MNGEGPLIRDLALTVHGVPEAVLPVGRPDVLTTSRAFEVEPVDQWRHGARQAFAYGGMTGLTPALAVFGSFDYLWLYLKIRDKMAPLELWRWYGQWEHISSRNKAKSFHVALSPEATAQILQRRSAALIGASA